MYGYFLAADYALLGIITTLVLPLILRCCQPPDINLILIGIAFKVKVTLSNKKVIIFVQ